MDIQIGVIGAGSWGTTLANLLAKKGFSIALWVYEDDLIQPIATKRENPLYLPGIKLSEKIIPTGSLKEVCQHKDLLVNVTPSQIVRQMMQNIHSYLSSQVKLVSATKGIENNTLLTMSGVFKEVLPIKDGEQLAVLSGPSFALEVSKETPTAVTIASKNQELAKHLQKVFSTPYFRAYTNSDVLGVELGGALKNVIAIAAGISDGLGFGYNTRAALITRGLAEMSRLALKMGANALTLSGLAGLGDLILTCTGELSRNRSVGIKLGKGMELTNILRDMRMVAEGIKTTKAAYDLSKKMEVSMPITEQVYYILYQNKNPKEAVTELLTRDLKVE
ncbi:MAG: NAD(P)H-dependent glycerol-3-phosphate dehydrogenase [Deltaproteobacteria bacterium]|nr:NAD(P)H-dependent glycerol-3-phosphate dehydrogenase [Deltaproteobacteria bacterium]